MEQPTWIGVDTLSHAFRVGRTVSLCGRADLPIGFSYDSGDDLMRCGHCQRYVVQRLTTEWQATVPATEQWREEATRAVMGDGWTYAEIQGMPSWKETVDRVAVGFAEAFREGIMQAGAGQ
jgi:hypothetical protein